VPLRRNRDFVLLWSGMAVSALLIAGFLLEAIRTAPATLAVAAWMLALAVVATGSPAIRKASARLDPGASTSAP
jgi:hypothetical protein